MCPLKQQKITFNALVLSAVICAIPWETDALAGYTPELKKAKVENVRVGRHKDKTRIVLDVDRPMPLRYEMSANQKAVFVHLPNVNWAASPFEPRHSKGNVLEFRFSPNKEGGIFNILTDGPVTVKKPFMVAPNRNRGHRLVIDLLPRNTQLQKAKTAKFRNHLLHKAAFSPSGKVENTKQMVAGLTNIGISDQDPPKVATIPSDKHTSSHKTAEFQVAQNYNKRSYSAEMFKRQTPQDLTHQKLYIKGLAGMTLLPEITNVGGGNENTMEFDPGFGVSGGVGISLTDEFRAEVEANYTSNTLTQLQGTGNGISFGQTTNASNDLTTISLMGNVAYDFARNGPILPYVSAGVGLAGVFMNEITANATQISDGSDWVFAMQFGAGVSLPIDDTTTLEAGYKYFETENPEMGDLRGTPFTTHFSSHSFLLGARLTY